MSYRQYAAHRGCTLRAVQKAVGDVDAKGNRTGRIGGALIPIEGNPHPKIDSKKADELWLLNTDETKRSTLFTPSDAASGVQPDLPGDEFDAPPGDIEPDVPTGDPESDAAKRSYHQSRAARSRIDAENAQLDLDLRKGKLIDLEEAKHLGYTTLRSLRDALGNIGTRIAAQVSALTDPFACEQLINAEIDAALAGITADRLLTESDDDTDGEGD